MSVKSIYGLRLTAGMSLVSAIGMTIVTTYVFASRVDDLLTSKFPSSSVPSNISSTNPKENTEYVKLLQDINDLWIRYRSVLVSSSMLATLAGFMQGIFCGLVAFSEFKSVRLYIRKWVTVHFILIFVFFVILLNTVVLTEHTDDKQQWIWLVNRLQYFLQQEPYGSRDYSSLYRLLSVNQYFIYVSVGVNLAVILTAIGLMMVIMRNVQDYEACE